MKKRNADSLWNSEIFSQTHAEFKKERKVVIDCLAEGLGIEMNPELHNLCDAMVRSGGKIGFEYGQLMEEKEIRKLEKSYNGPCIKH